MQKGEHGESPFSAIPTQVRARANDRWYWANCAWDMLGVPAALHSDAEIEAWYGNRLSPDYRGRTAEEIREIFGHFGLDKMCLHMEGPS